MFKNFRTENELRKIASICSVNGKSAGFSLPSLKDILRDFKSANKFYEKASSNNWRPREVALAVFGGLLADSIKDGVEGTDETMEAFADMIIEKDFWYDKENSRIIFDWMTEVTKVKSS